MVINRDSQLVKIQRLRSWIILISERQYMTLLFQRLRDHCRSNVDRLEEKDKVGNYKKIVYSEHMHI